MSSYPNLFFSVSRSGVELYQGGLPLVFFHVPKTAGTTVSSLLKAHFGSAMCEVKSQAGLDELSADYGGLALVSGHLQKEKVFRTFAKDRFLTLFRKPHDRVVSQYANWRDDDRIEWGDSAWEVDGDARRAIEIAQSSDLEGFLTIANEQILRNTANVFTRAFCDREWVDPREDDPALVESAFENLRSFFWLGLVERMDQSLLVLSRQLCANTLVFGARNVRNASKDLPVVSREAARLIHGRNRLDIALYELVVQEFEARLLSVLRDAIRPVLKTSGSQRFEQYCELQRLDWGQIHFMAGWSYEEHCPDGTKFRWSFAGCDADIMVPCICIQRELFVRLHILALGAGLQQSRVGLKLNYAKPRRSKWTSVGNGWTLDCWFDVPAGEPTEIMLSLAVDASEVVNIEDARDVLGVALCGVELRTDSFSDVDI
ncbi:MAG: hypothetical protein ACK52K_18215 [Alphaproteobacteria bacterium]|jgi:hypothetical protein